METKQKNTKKIATTAIMLSLALILSMIKVFKLPLGGSITLLSMLPVCLISLKYGMKWGLGSAFVYSIMQIAADLPELMGWGMDIKIWIGCIVFDYVLAFTCIGLAGVFKRHARWGIILGIILACFARFACHLISGAIFFDVWMPSDWSNVWLYSICYNGSFMLPEMIFTTVGAYLIGDVLKFTKD